MAAWIGDGNFELSGECGVVLGVLDLPILCVHMLFVLDFGSVLVVWVCSSEVWVSVCVDVCALSHAVVCAWLFLLGVWSV